MTYKLFWLGIAIITTGSAFGRGGNGEGFNGGDPLHAKLLATRKGMQNAFNWIKKDYAIERLCNPRFCSWKEASCDALRSLTNESYQTCKNFITESADQYLALLSKDPNKAFVVRNKSLKDPAAKGEVAAITKSAADAPIYFNSKKIEALSADALFTLLVHEYGHKITFNGQAITDTEDIAGFQNGRQLLDTVGIALYHYSLELPVERGLASLSLTQVYRSYNRATESHFFTLSKVEHENGVKSGNEDESKSFPFYVFPAPVEGSVPVYRFVKKSGQVGFYLTKEVSEKDREMGFEYDGIAFYVWKEPRMNTFEIFRMVNSNGGASLLTVSGAEVDAVSKSPYWKKGESLGFVPKN